MARTSVKIAKWVFSLLLISIGVMLAHDVGRLDYRMTRAVTRNPASIVFTTFVFEHLPEPVWRFEQDLLYYLPLAPYLVLLGLFAGLVFAPETARYGAWIPLGYAVWLEISLVHYTWGRLHWTIFIPNIIWYVSLVPTYLTGVALGRAIAERRLPKWKLMDLFGITTYFSILLVCVVYRPYLAIPSVILAGLCLLTYRSWPTQALPARNETCENPV